MNGYEIICPKDQDAGGSWIAVKNNSHAAVLLNGAFIKHNSLPPYRKSRGLIFLDIIGAENPDVSFAETDLAGIEAFTLILFISKKLLECRWDGKQKHTIHLNHTTSHIWSSVTLYETKIRQEREHWFNEWIDSGKEFSTENIINFHKNAGTGDSANDLLMERNGKMSTVSITSIAVTPATSCLTYYDIKNKTSSALELENSKKDLNPTHAIGSLILYIKKSLIRICHWEYWPFSVVYAPLIPYWFWLSLKARSFFFFSAANTSILNAGFVLEKKSTIYDLIPEEYYPKTLFCKKETGIHELPILLAAKQLNYPLIAKPDIGEKGIRVKLLQTSAELIEYTKNSHVDFLIQEFIDYKQEAGIFYYRVPGEENGSISGIVGKEFLGVVGNGKSSIEELLMKEQRFILQIPALKAAYGKFLNHVLAPGTMYTLVPYGNHSRGAKFIDLSHKINADLTETINKVCRQIPGFYYGRLDIKFNNWDEFCAGRNFSIIELNGAGSEPTHMYDPAHSIFFAWREITRHWNLLYTISRLNAKKEGLVLMRTAEGLQMLKDHGKYLKLIS